MTTQTYENPAALPQAPAKVWLTYGDAMRVLGVLAVIVVHTCDMVMFTKPVGTAVWWAANLIDATGRWAVPVFIMLSGALLLSPSRQESAGDFYRRRLARLGIAVAFWSAFFMLFAVYYTGWSHGGWAPLPRPNDWKSSIWQQLLAGAPYVHLHFVFRLGGLYLITPMLRVFVRNAPWNLRAMTVLILLGLGMANSVAACFLGEYAGGKMVFSNPSAFVILWPFLGFYLAGNVLREIPVTRRLLGWSCAAFVLCWAAMACGTALTSPAGAKMNPYPHADVMLYDFLSVPRVAMSVAAWFILAYVFGQISSTGDGQSPLQRFFTWAAPLTLGIYLVHPLFREVLWVKTNCFSWPNEYLAMPVMMLLISAGSLLLTWMISLVPGLRRIVG